MRNYRIVVAGATCYDPNTLPPDLALAWVKKDATLALSVTEYTGEADLVHGAQYRVHVGEAGVRFLQQQIGELA